MRPLISLLVATAVAIASIPAVTIIASSKAEAKSKRETCWWTTGATGQHFRYSLIYPSCPGPPMTLGNMRRGHPPTGSRSKTRTHRPQRG